MAVRVDQLARIAGLTGAALALGAGAAQARPATLWGCHGPLGQPLGVTGLVPSQAVDGVAPGPGACTGSQSLLASFSRPDPAGGAAASWSANVPPGAALLAVRIERTLTPAAGPLAPGASQRYVARAGATLLESIDLAGPATPGAVVRLPTAGSSVVFGVDCPRVADERCGSGAAGALTVSSIALDVDDVVPPRGSVSGSTGPARGAVTLEISAGDDGVGLASARAYVDGAPSAQVALDAACTDLDPATAAADLPLTGCARRVSRIPLSLDLSSLAVGEHRLQVRLADAAGNEAEVYDGSVTLAGAPPIYSPTVVLTIGDPPKPPSPSPAAGSAVLGTSTAAGCASPRLSMALDQRPLRIGRGRPVLRSGARYRYRGRVTCLVGKRRRGAPRGTPVELLNRIGARTWAVTGATTAGNGRLTMILAYRVSRTLIFRHRSAAGASQVRIPITIAKAKRR